MISRHFAARFKLWVLWPSLRLLVKVNGSYKIKSDGSKSLAIVLVLTLDENGRRNCNKLIYDTLFWDASPPLLFSSFSCVAQGTRLRWRWPGTQFYLWYWMHRYPGDLPFCIELYQKKKLNAFKTPWISGLSMRQVGLNNLKERHLVSHPSHAEFITLDQDRISMG